MLRGMKGERNRTPRGVKGRRGRRLSGVKARRSRSPRGVCRMRRRRRMITKVGISFFVAGFGIMATSTM